ncbi:MAG: hypothetical protein IIA83_11205, partial [Thaumarchaeota archaeon]|nr:hypothetical protein [Nitrososphaerota archaeon]
MFEIISISSVIGYAIGFFIFLANRKSRDSNNEVFNTNNKVKKKTSVYRDKVWKKFTIVFGVLMGFLVSAFILASWGDSTPITVKISNVASIFGVFLAVYIAVWVYKVEMNKKDEKEKENEYYKININDSFYKLGLKMQDIFKPNEEKMKEKLQEEQSEQFNDLQKELNEKSEKIKELNRTKAEIEKLKREKAELKEAVEADAQKKLNEALLAEREKIKKTEEERNELRFKELEKQLEDQK